MNSKSILTMMVLLVFLLISGEGMMVRSGNWRICRRVLPIFTYQECYDEYCLRLCRGEDMMVRSVDGRICQRVLPISTYQVCYDEYCMRLCRGQLGPDADGLCLGVYTCNCTYPC
ncbi:hypothetical protein SDJN03_24898, partial [Cucurbita argyrosperma subsp. sororia]